MLCTYTNLLSNVYNVFVCNETVMYHDDFPSNLGHCLVMEVLKMNLHEFAQRSRSGLPAGAIAISETRLVAFQLFVALEFLEKHKIVHCDLKPHNVMVSNLNPLRIKVIDFGSAESTNTLVWLWLLLVLQLTKTTKLKRLL